MGGDHGHGHGHAPPYVVPDYKIYKVEDIPKLMAVKKKLAEKGLSDPWLRNEVWRYDKQFPTILGNLKYTFTRGLITASILMAITIGYEQFSGGSKSHGHDDKHH